MARLISKATQFSDPREEAGEPAVSLSVSVFWSSLSVLCIIWELIPVCILYCSVWGVWEDGILWDLIKLGAIPNWEASPGNCWCCKQCHQLGWDCVLAAHSGSIRRRCSPGPILDLRRWIRNLSLGKTISLVSSIFLPAIAIGTLCSWVVFMIVIWFVC